MTGPRVTLYLCPPAGSLPAGHRAGPEGSGWGGSGQGQPRTRTFHGDLTTCYRDACRGGARRPFSKLEAEGLQPFIYTSKAKSSILLGLEMLS